jgi:hypothetical protein
MPAWQKRQPRVQPRMISMAARLWTTLMYGTMNFVTGGGSTVTTRLSTSARAAG